MIWSNLPCNEFRIAHMKMQTIAKLFDKSNVEEQALGELACHMLEGLVDSDVKFVDIQNDMAVLVQ